MEKVIAEWLESDGLGGFAMGCSDLVPRRRYHAFLTAALEPPSIRYTLLNGIVAWVEFGNETIPLSSFRFTPGVTHPSIERTLTSFSHSPWPTWEFSLSRDSFVRFEFFMTRGAPLACFRWSYHGKRAPAVLCVRPLFSVRDFHALHHQNKDFKFDSRVARDSVTITPYLGAPGIKMRSNGSYQVEPLWYHNFLYDYDRERGFEAHEDLATPGILRFDLQNNIAALLVTHSATRCDALERGSNAQEALAMAAQAEAARRKSFPSLLARATEHYIVRRGDEHTIIAGYPWFTDWGRDTCIAVRGLCTAQGNFETAASVLRAWGKVIDRGMVPNRFPDYKGPPEYNSVDASLWYIITAAELLATTNKATAKEMRPELVEHFDQILTHYEQGTRFGIQADSDGLLFSGETGVQLTWMDAKIGDFVVTPRTGKAVEVQALWLNALWIAGTLMESNGAYWRSLYERGRTHFQRKFWNAAQRCLHDVVDADRRLGAVDSRVRPNQIFAVGGLPQQLLPPAQARSVVDIVEQTLYCPHGLRTLAPGERGYAPRYYGAPEKRDLAYHMGTAWPWLLGSFAEAWARVRGNSRKVRHEAFKLFIHPLLTVAGEQHGGNLPEIADAEAPFAWRGAPCQAWSLAELLRAKNALTG